MKTDLAEFADVAMHAMYSGDVGLEVALLCSFVITQVARVFFTLHTTEGH
jgi:hypothetical protein